MLFIPSSHILCTLMYHTLRVLYISDCVSTLQLSLGVQRDSGTRIECYFRTNWKWKDNVSPLHRYLPSHIVYILLALYNIYKYIQPAQLIPLMHIHSDVGAPFQLYM